MNRFAIAQPDSFTQAVTVLKDDRFRGPMIKAGGIDLLDHLKEGLVEPDLLVDVRKLSSNGSATPIHGDAATELHLEATTTLTEIAESDLLQQQAPVVVQSIEDAATPQVRNVATAAGNLLQRPRCWYYRNAKFDCNKKGGDQCFARHGENRFHAIFWSGPCVIVHPSNLAPALMVCDAVLHLTGGSRTSIPLAGFYHMPDRGLLDEYRLGRGEIVTHITFSAAPRSGFCAIKERQSVDWPLVTAAAALELNGTVIRSARICAGAVAPTPWPLRDVARALVGVNVKDDGALRKACAGAGAGADPLAQNAYKVELLPVAVRRAVRKAAGISEEVT